MADDQSPDTSNTNQNLISVKVPDIGGDSAKVIEILVAEGDEIDVEDSIVTLESEKASMDVPSTHQGVVKSIKVSIDDDVSEGQVLIEVSGAAGEQDAADSNEESAQSKPEQAESEQSQPEQKEQQKEQQAEEPKQSEAPAASNSSESINVKVPDIGSDSAKVIEILVAVGDQVELESPLITLESDKASMDVPSSAVGEISEILVEIDQELSEGDPIVTILAASTDNSATQNQTTADQSENSVAKKKSDASSAQPVAASATSNTSSAKASAPANTAKAGSKAHASPSVRRFARELGADLSSISGSGRKGRVTKEDVKAFVKQALTSKSSAPQSSGAGIPAIPSVDFSKFGETENQPLNKIKRLTAANLHRSWLNVPHVTHNDESDISDLEDFRKQLNKEYAEKNRDIKLSPLAFVVKAVVNALQTYPQFNSSLDPSGEHLILKKYFNIGIAVDTPNGLVVPVVKGADKMSVAEIAKEMGNLAAKARDKKLTMADMSGACITISSLGGIGGTDFTPIVNAPEVAILGVSRSKISPVWNGSEFEPRMMLPLSLSYDHRVIDGAEAARFARHIATVLEDVRRLVI